MRAPDGAVLEFANLHGADLRYASLQRALLTGFGPRPM